MVIFAQIWYLLVSVFMFAVAYITPSTTYGLALAKVQTILAG